MACEFEPYGLIGDRWRLEGGANSYFGCPTSRVEEDVHDEFGTLRGRRMYFTNGQMVWSPGQGPNMLVRAFENGGMIAFEWGPTDPFNYDRFIVRWAVSGAAAPIPNAQEDVHPEGRGRTRTTGYFHVPFPNDMRGGDGRVGVSFIVEGYDDNGGARQGWTCPIQCRLG